VRLADLVETSRRVAETSRRSQKIGLLASALRQAAPGEAALVTAYLSGSPPQGRIGIGYSMLRDASAPPAAEASLTLAEVGDALQALTQAGGSGSGRRKRELLHSLFARATETEQRFLNGLLTGELRQGALEGLMVDAVAKAFAIEPARVRRAVMMAGDLGVVARAALESGAASLDCFDVQLFRPIQPMLAQMAEDAASALEDLGEAALEYKFDGARIQAHRSGDEVRIFTRALNDVTAAAPEIVEAVRALPAHELILDGEAISFTPEGRPQPFQVTMRRFGRKLDIGQVRAELPLTPVWFDLLYQDGGSRIDEPQARRFAELAELVPPELLAPHLTTADPGRAEQFLRESLDRGHEGVMAKAPGSRYEAGSRGQGWLKIKKTHTLDLVILAAEWGHGRRRGWLSNLHLGARDAATGGFAMLGKTFKGLTDEMLAWQTQELLKLEVARDAYTVYVQPKLVVEVAFGDLQLRSRYPSGLALRFARIKRYRPDKPAADADTFQTVQQLASAMEGMLDLPGGN